MTPLAVLSFSEILGALQESTIATFAPEEGYFVRAIFQRMIIDDCMAEDAVLCELLSADFPANRERYREYCALNRAPSAISPQQRELWRGIIRSCGHSKQGSIRERTGEPNSLLSGN